jgi:outer membrane receptor protein involved in Fe transport
MFRKKYLILPVAACLQGMAFLQAQTLIDSVDSPIRLEEVVISSGKETFRREELPASVSILPARELERKRIESLKSISAHVPNLYIPDYGSKLYAPVYIRGIGTRTGSPSVGLYVDGVPYMETTSFDFDLSDIDRIEVLRGPQGTLYGRNTMAGIINVTTLSPLQHRGTAIRLSGGNYGDAKAGVSHHARIGKKWGIAAGVNYLRKGGYFTNEYTGKKADERNDVSGRLRLTVQHSAKMLSDLHAHFEHSRQEGYPYSRCYLQTVDAGKTDSLKIERTDSVNYDHPSSYTRDLLSAGYRFAYSARRFTVRAVTGYQHVKDIQDVDQDFLPAPMISAMQKQRQNMLSQEVIARSDLSGNYRWVTGVFGFVQQTDKEVDAFMKPADTHDWRSYDQLSFGWAVYHQSSYHNLLTRGLSATLGVRLDDEQSRQKYINRIITSSATREQANTDFPLRFFEFLPKASLSYRPARQSFYVSVAKGYKTGGFNVSFNTEEERTFDPETSWNYEAGVKLQLPGATSIDAALFYIDWSNQQITQVIALSSGGSGSVIHNAGQSESKGVEVSVNTRPVKNLTANVHYGFTRARFKKYVYSDRADYSGNRIPLVPGQTVSAGASYRLPVAGQWLDEVVFHTQYSGTGKLFWLEKNTLSQDYYGLLDAGVAFRKGIVGVSVWAKNILAAKYNVYYFEIAQLNASYIQQGRPFTCGVDIKIDLRR